MTCNCKPDTTPQTGTLQELNVKPGDVVEYADSGVHQTIIKKEDGKYIGDKCLSGEFLSKRPHWRIITRASDDTLKLWRDMTDAEKGALLLAEHEGRVIEWSASGKSWKTSHMPTRLNNLYYRIKPEPKCETVVLCGHGNVFEDRQLASDTHRITFDTEDGEPVCDSIKMERL